MVEGLGKIDWSRPWLAPYREIGMRVAARVVGGASVAQALNDEAPHQRATAADSAAPPFVAAALLPPGVAYEAFIEKLVRPRKAITAHVWAVADGGETAADLSAHRLASKPFLPLPVLGVPGWWPDNDERSFYYDAAVFRPKPQPGRNPSIDRYRSPVS